MFLVVLARSSVASLLVESGHDNTKAVPEMGLVGLIDRIVRTGTLLLVER